MSGDDFIRAGEAPRHEIKQPVWLMSFADFAGCLLASFVLLYSLAQTDRARMQAAFGIETVESDIDAEEGTAEKSMAAKPAPEGRDTDYLATLLATKIEAAPALKDVLVLPREGSVTLELPMERIDAEAAREEDLLFALAGLLAVTPNEAAISADMPEDGKAGNWGKGIVLANALVTRLQDAGAPDTLTARTGISTDDAPHIRAVIFREAEE
ncbi:flagellar motor protein MotB [Dongia sp.]|uniref:flagellar motor protein MotB n=1 Tax=Dongia sp. TaxID=1977262 RepID=UPI0035B0F688